MTKTFEEAWAEKEREGFQYGEDALEYVRFGWELRGDPNDRLLKEIEAKLQGEGCLKEALRLLLQERAAMLANLNATQFRCGWLLEESRAMKRRLQELGFPWLGFPW